MEHDKVADHIEFHAPELRRNGGLVVDVGIDDFNTYRNIVCGAIPTIEQVEFPALGHRKARNGHADGSCTADKESFHIETMNKNV